MRPDKIVLEYIGKVSSEAYYMDFCEMTLYERTTNGALLHYRHATKVEELVHAKKIIEKDKEFLNINFSVRQGRLEKLVKALWLESE